jgi:hypothetical protein
MPKAKQEYVRQHPGWSWAQEWDNITVQVNENIRQLAEIMAQQQERQAKIDNAQFLLSLLDDSRQNAQEKGRIIRMMQQLTAAQPLLQKMADKVETRLKGWKAKADAFPQAELILERKLINARAKLGTVDAQASRAEQFIALE